MEEAQYSSNTSDLIPQLPFDLLYSENEAHPGKPDFDKISNIVIDYLQAVERFPINSKNIIKYDT